MWIASAFGVAAAALALGGCHPARRPAAAAATDAPVLRGTIVRATDDGREILLALSSPARGVSRAAGPVRVALGARTPVRGGGVRGGRDALRRGAAVRVYWHGLVIDTAPPLVGGDSVVVERRAP